MDGAPQPAGPPASFLFATCQVGAEAALKGELARRWPDFRFAYSRPGFLTFKLPAGFSPSGEFELDSVFARAWGFSLGKATAADPAERVAQAWQLAGGIAAESLHVWQRDLLAAGDHGFEPGLTELARAAAQSIAGSQGSRGGRPPLVANLPARRGQTVLDCIVVEPDQWWIGWHVARETCSCWPGGIFDRPLPEDAISRAYLKIEEALAWSGLPLKRGDEVAEIGCAPGGASQALLARGMKVIGIDPAEVDPRLLAERHFTHLRKRGAEVRRRELRDVRWLVADMNVAPAYTLATLGEIVSHPAVHVSGMILTLKLLEWQLAADVPAFLDQVRDWGFSQVAARQLSHNRQEICVAARR